MIVAFSISPTSGDETGSVSEAVAAAVRVVKESGLPYELNSMFTNVEGEWDEVMAVVKRAVDVTGHCSSGSTHGRCSAVATPSRWVPGSNGPSTRSPTESG